MFLLLPVAVDYRASRQPVITYALIGACALLYLLTLGFSMRGDPEAFEAWFRGLALIPADALLHHWVTSLFVHAGFLHLLGNMVYLYLFGACVEDLFGRGKFLLFYLAGGTAASLMQVPLMPGGFDSPIPLVGASGAIAACMGAFVVLLRRTTVELRLIYWFIAFGAREFYVPSWVLLWGYFVLDAIGMHSSLGENTAGGTAFAAHIGGFLFGMSVAGVARSFGFSVPSDDKEPVPVRVRTRSVSAEVPGPPIHLWHRNAQTGPFPLREVQSMLALGALDADCLYWNEQPRACRPVRELARTKAVGSR